jgi:hypothetical protein
VDLIDQCERCNGKFPVADLEFSRPGLELLCQKCQRDNLPALGHDEPATMRGVVAIIRTIEDEVNALPMSEVERRLAELPPHWQAAVAQANGETDRRAILVDFLFLESDSR